jgi:cytochrome o ubiquinol oxidase subunit 3
MNPAKLEEQNQLDKTTVLGFWVYIMTDCVLFATLFATYAVLHGNVNGGEGGQQLFNLSSVLAETLILLSSSFACGMAMLAAKAGDRRAVMAWLAVTALLGLAFLGIELSEFHQLAAEGNSWRRSGFLSAFFTLVGTHGLHITAGLLWLLTLVWRLSRVGLDRINLRRLTLFSMFWHFLDLVWIFIFTVVYLTGGLGL